MTENITGIASAIFIAGVSSLITVQLSLRRFRTEKWWERKAEAYSKILEALHNAKEFSAHHLDAAGEGREINEEKDEELRAKVKAATAEIRRLTDIGGFLLSDKAMERLKRFQMEEKAAGKARDWYEYLDGDWKATSGCLGDLIVIAKKDLKV